MYKKKKEKEKKVVILASLAPGVKSWLEPLPHLSQKFQAKF